ncbi:hypothetical protein B1R94_14930 [Mycolicibacterium litorale]|nr:hypothetical protein B1R94_14930 [Mycolicibacterium litorale]
MNRAVFATLGTVAALTVGACSTHSAAPAPTGSDLKGTWVQSGAGFEKGGPVTWVNQTVVIDKAEGQGFAGYKEYTREGEQPQRETVNGVVSSDGDILITDNDGTFRGKLVNGTVTGQYAEMGPDGAAMNVELTKK